MLLWAQVRLIGLVGSQPEVRQIGDQAIAQITLGVRGRATSSGMELNWVTVDCWNYEVLAPTEPHIAMPASVLSCGTASQQVLDAWSMLYCTCKCYGELAMQRVTCMQQLFVLGAMQTVTPLC